MKISSCSLVFSFLITLALLPSCGKFRAKKLAGKYLCRIDYHYWDMLPTLVDSTYFEEIEIKQAGKNLIVLGTTIPIDSLWKEKQYFEGSGGYNYLQVLFKKDSLYITKSGGGLGGHASWTYAGLKK